MSRSVVAHARGALAACATALLATAGTVTLAATPAAAAEGTVSDATLSWGVRESFRSYIESPIANGEVRTEGVAEQDGAYGFSAGSGSADPDAGTAEVSFPGSVHFLGHESTEPGVYILDLLIEDLQVEVAGPDEVYLVADLTSRPFESTTEPSDLESYPDLRLARVDPESVTISDELISADGAATTLTEDGSVGFGGFYDPGAEMDPVTFSLPVTVVDDADEGDGSGGDEDSAGDDTDESGDDGSAAPGDDGADGTDGQDGDQGTDPSAGGEDGRDQGTDPGAGAGEGTEPGVGGDEGNENADTEALGTALAAESTNLTWGLKESFRSYIEGPIAGGEISTDGGVAFDGAEFTFTGGAGAGDSADQTAEIAYPGSISFTGHDGLLDLTVSDLRLRIDSPTSASIVATVVSKSLDSSEFETFTGIDFADLTVTGADVAEGNLRISNAPAVLTEDGAAGFAGFYAAGTELDPVSAQVTFTPTEEDVTPPPSSEPKPRENTNDGPTRNPAGDPAGEGAGSPADDPAAGPPAGSAESTPVCTATSISGASLTWGLKSSFRSYISGGIANGGWTTDGGVSDVDGGWTWSGGSGSINAQTLGGTISFPGTLHFTGHDGILDMQISNLSLRMTGPDTASLYATVVSNDMEGNASTYSGIQFATVSFPAVGAGSDIAISGAEVTLTAAGADGFAGFYEAGTALDPLDAQLPLGGAVDCSAAAGTTLAATGVSPVAPVLALAGLLALLGVALTVRRSVLR